MTAQTVWIGTRKGAFALQSDERRDRWALIGPEFLGHVIHHIVQDPRDPNSVLMAAKTGHLGPTVFRSNDGGRTWKEAAQPPAFRVAASNEKGRSVERVFWLTAGHVSQPKTWYAGTSPCGLFHTEDDGEHWESVSGFNDHPSYTEWTGDGGTPDGPLLHSILVDPRDAAHLYVGLSGGGVFESLDAGASWTPLNEGCAADFLPDSHVPFGHDPHCVVLHPLEPDRLYQQNHCGIYRLDRPERHWIRIGNAMPKNVGDIGFPIVLHPTNPDIAWVHPMDGQTVWPRTSIDGKPAVYMTRDAGASWVRQDKGLPPSQAWMTVLRQAMCADTCERVGLYFGTTGGEVWASANEGESWRCLARNLPEIYSVTCSRALNA